ncbi:hypothetical protein D3C72_1986510 [compost metagenome]
MPIDIGDKLQYSARAVCTTGIGGQAYTPIAAANAYVYHRLPFLLGICLLHEIAHPLMFARNGFNGLRGAQHGVPRGAVFRLVDGVSGKQGGAGLVKTSSA